MNSFESILAQIISKKEEQIASRKQNRSLESLKKILENEQLPALRPFEQTLRNHIEKNGIGIIAEIKKASPSKGLLCENFEPSIIAEEYQKAGAACLSVLTETDFFLGDDDHLRLARNATTLPILRKDFIIDEYQLFESLYLGADCVLLIAAALSKTQLEHFYQIAKLLNLDVLVEVNDEQELMTAVDMKASMIGINNRNLKDFSVDLDRTIMLANKIPSERLVVCESGIKDRNDIQHMLNNHLQAFLIGETLVRASSPGDKLAELLADTNQPS